MFLHVIKAKYLSEYKIWLEFNNGKEGIVNIDKELDGEAFESLRNPENFKKFTVGRSRN